MSVKLVENNPELRSATKKDRPLLATMTVAMGGLTMLTMVVLASVSSNEQTPLPEGISLAQTARNVQPIQLIEIGLGAGAILSTARAGDRLLGGR